MFILSISLKKNNNRSIKLYRLRYILIIMYFVKIYIYINKSIYIYASRSIFIFCYMYSIHNFLNKI
jgi:hypothetical protein